MTAPNRTRTSSRPFDLTKHAIERALDMGVSGDEILHAVNDPQAVRPSGGRELRTHGRITVVFAPEPRLVVSVLWRYQTTRKTDVLRAANYGRAAENATYSRERERLRRRKTRHPKNWEGGRSNRRPRTLDSPEDW